MDKTVSLFIIVADDDLDDHMLINEAVKQCNQNHIITSVYNGAQLIDLLMRRGFYKSVDERTPDLIILDLRMPVMGGLEALEKIRALEEYRSVPIFVLTQNESEKEFQKAKNLGATDYFVKPLNFEELKGLMLKVCQKVSNNVA